MDVQCFRVKNETNHHEFCRDVQQKLGERRHGSNSAKSSLSVEGFLDVNRRLQNRADKSWNLSSGCHVASDERGSIGSDLSSPDRTLMKPPDYADDSKHPSRPRLRSAGMCSVRFHICPSKRRNSGDKRRRRCRRRGSAVQRCFSLI